MAQAHIDVVLIDAIRPHNVDAHLGRGVAEPALLIAPHRAGQDAQRLSPALHQALGN